MSTTMMLAADITATSGDTLKTIALGLLGTFFLIWLGGRVVILWAQDKFGKMTAVIAAGIIVAGFIYFPDTSIGILKSLYTKFIGV